MTRRPADVPIWIPVVRKLEPAEECRCERMLRDDGPRGQHQCQGWARYGIEPACQEVEVRVCRDCVRQMARERADELLEAAS